MPPVWMIVAGIAAFTAAISEFANRRRSKRTDINKVGFMPWPSITAFSLLTFGISVAVGLGLIDMN